MSEMATRRRPPTRKPDDDSKEKLAQAAKTTANVDEIPAPAEIEPSPEAYPAVVVMCVPSKEKPGDEQVQVAAINGLHQLAIESLLKMGLKVNAAQLGLN